MLLSVKLIQHLLGQQHALFTHTSSPLSKPPATPRPRAILSLYIIITHLIRNATGIDDPLAAVQVVQAIGDERADPGGDQVAERRARIVQVPLLVRNTM